MCCFSSIRFLFTRLDSQTNGNKATIHKQNHVSCLELRAFNRLGSRSIIVTIVIDAVLANLLVVLLKGSEIFTGFAELSFLHTFADIPVDEGPLSIHEIEFVVDAGEDFGNSGGVGQHAAGTLNLGKIAARHSRGGFVVDTALETSGAPIDELNAAVGLDLGNGRADVLGNDYKISKQVLATDMHFVMEGIEITISAVHHANGHVLAMARIALSHHGVGFEYSALQGRVES